ncbi:MAG: DUF6517 family protein [Halolamina sp.]
MRLTRRAVGALAVAGITGLAGCSGGDTTSFEAEAAATATGDTGYEKKGQREQTITKEFAGQEVEVTNVITEYQKEVEIPLTGSAKLGVFTAFTTPEVSVAGQEFNPIKDWSTEKIVKQLQSRYESMGNVQKEGTESHEILGSSRTVTKFSATMTYQGNDVPVFILIAKFNHESDFVVPMGVFPQRKEDQEGANIRTLMSNLSHPA